MNINWDSTLKKVFHTVKFLFQIIIVITTLTLNAHPSRTWNERASILTDEDYQMEVNEEYPGLTIFDSNGEKRYESWNYWQCFSTQEIEFKCWDKISDNGHFEGQDPGIIFFEGGIFYAFFGLGEAIKMDCKILVSLWEGLLNGQEEVCAYGAFNEEYAPTSDGYRQTSWVLYSLKTALGSWSYFHSPQEEEEEEEEEIFVEE